MAAETNHLNTEDAAAVLGLKRSRVQQLCRAWITSEGIEGLRCERVGKGRHAVYLILRTDAEGYATRDRKRGWPKGKKRTSGFAAAPASRRDVVPF